MLIERLELNVLWIHADVIRRYNATKDYFRKDNTNIKSAISTNKVIG